MSKGRYTGPSEAQSNADALARRSTTYADEHAASWSVRFGARPTNMTTKALVAELTRALSEQTPDRLHEGPDHIDAGGVPAMTGNFLAYLEADDDDTIEHEARRDSQGRELRPVIRGTYRKPLHAALDSMKRADGKIVWWGRIAERIILQSEQPVLAAMAEGSHQHEAVRTANEALSELYRRVTPDKMTLSKVRTAA